MSTSPPSTAAPGVIERFTWVASVFGAAIVGGFVLVLWAIFNEETRDVAASPYHLPLYLAFAALVVTCAVLAIRAWRTGVGWTNALPPGFGTLGAAAAIFVLGLVLDAGWREGVGIQPGIEDGFAPSRVVIAIGLALVAVTPLRAALVLGPTVVPRAPVLLSAALTIVAIGWVGGFHPTASPWLAVDPALPSVNADIWVMNPDGANQTRLIEAGSERSLGYASWAPDGSAMAYTSFDLPPGGIAVSHAAIWTSDATGADARSLLDDGEWRWIPRFSPDGTVILFTQEARGGPWMEEGPVGPGVGAGPQGPLTIPLPNADIWSTASDGSGEAERLSDSAGDDRAPVPSPDGRLVLFDSTRDGNTELYVMAADGTDPRRLTDDPAEDWGASWSPDGTHIAFNSFRTGSMEIFVMEADGSGVRQLTFDEADNVSPSWSPDGSRIVYTARDFRGLGQVWSMAVDGGDRRDLSRSPSSNDQVWTGGWGPDGRILFTRALAPVVDATPIVRWDFGTAALLLAAGLIAAIVVLFSLTEPLPGSFTAVLVIATALLAVPAGEWRFVAAGAAAGLATDLVVWLAPPRWRGRAAGAVSAATFVIGAAAVALATTGLEWSPTLALGVALAAGVLGWAIGALAGIGEGRMAAEPG